VQHQTKLEKHDRGKVVTYGRKNFITLTTGEKMTEKVSNIIGRFITNLKYLKGLVL